MKPSPRVPHGRTEIDPGRSPVGLAAVRTLFGEEGNGTDARLDAHQGTQCPPPIIGLVSIAPAEIARRVLMASKVRLAAHAAPKVRRRIQTRLEEVGGRSTGSAAKPNTESRRPTQNHLTLTLSASHGKLESTLSAGVRMGQIMLPQQVLAVI